MMYKTKQMVPESKPVEQKTEWQPGKIRVVSRINNGDTAVIHMRYWSEVMDWVRTVEHDGAVYLEIEKEV